MLHCTLYGYTMIHYKDDKFTPTKHLTNTSSPPQQQPARSGSHRNRDTPAAPNKTKQKEKKGRTRRRTATTDLAHNKMMISFYPYTYTTYDLRNTANSPPPQDHPPQHHSSRPAQRLTPTRRHPCCTTKKARAIQRSAPQRSPVADSDTDP